MKIISPPIQMFRVPDDSPGNFHKLGSQFLDAARLVFEKGKFAPSFPAYALIGQAIELYLKAYLRGKGLPVGKLKSIGHNLKMAFEEAEKFGLLQSMKMETDERITLEKLSLVYQSRDFHYKNQGSWELPFPVWTIDFATRLSQCIPH